MKNCRVCGELKELNAFVKQKLCKNGVQNICKLCSNQRLKKYRKSYPKADNYFHTIKRKYNVSPDHYEWLCEEHGGLCAICQRPETDFGLKRLSIDHNHANGLVRGLLCRQCNVGLGQFEDREDLLLKAAEYLKMRKSSI